MSGAKPRLNEHLTNMTDRIAQMGELITGTAGDTLSAPGLGSCVCVVLYDPVAHIAALAHVMLPQTRKDDDLLCKALIVYPDEALATYMKAILFKNTISSLNCPADVSAILTSYEKTSPQIIITNYDVLQKLLKQRRNPPRTIVIGSKELKDENLQGERDVVFLPFSADMLMSSVVFVGLKEKLKYAEHAIPVMFWRIINRGAVRERIRALIVGGARLFTLDDESVMKTGERNTLAVRKQLFALGIHIAFEETGGEIGRTLHFDIETNHLTIHTKDGTKHVDV